LRPRIDALLLAISRHRFAGDRAFCVLTADNVNADFLFAEATDRPHHFDLFVSNTVGPEIGRRFHSDQAKQLQKMILHHVAQRAGAFVRAGAIFSA
jgi:hypothetical protein